MKQARREVTKRREPTFDYAVKVPFLTRVEFARFRQFCKSNAHHQGGFVRLAILEKIEREEKLRRAVSE
jgi:hypothetical protein